MTTLLPTEYGPVITPLLAAAPLNELGPGQAALEMRTQLEAIDSSFEKAVAPRRIADPTMARACLAGLWLRFDYFDQSHEISQGIHNATGSFWHGILHRREPDYDNAKYWFQRVPEHAVFGALCHAARELAERTHKTAALAPAAEFLSKQRHWEPFHFVDLVAEAIRSKSEPLVELCRNIQRREWELLFEHCYRHAVGIEKGAVCQFNENI